MAETYSLADVRAMSAPTLPTLDERETFSLADVQAMRRDDASLTRTNGRALTVGGIPAAAFKTAEAMGTPAGRAEVLRLGLGAVRGAADIGNTILGAGSWVGEKLYNALHEKSLSDLIAPQEAPIKRWNDERKQSLDRFFDERIPQGNISAGVGRLGTNIAGTAGVGPALAVPVRALGGNVPAVSALANAIESGGMATRSNLARNAPIAARAADIGLRIVGGAITGGASAGLIEPSSAGAGAAIGGALPPVVAGLGAAGRAGGNAYRSATTPSDVKLARDIAQMGGVNAQNLEELARLRDALRQQGPSLLPGSEPTVPQIMQAPGVSQLQRSVKAANPAALTAREAEQHAARLEALNRIAPVSGTVQQAAEDAGNSIAGYAIPARNAEKARVSRLFEGVDPRGETRINLPTDEMKAARDQFMGRGTFGAGGAAEQAIHKAEEIGKLATFQEIQNLRSSIGEAFRASNRNGNAKEAAALGKMLKEIDGRVAAVSDGTGTAAEYFPAETTAKWKEALAAHKARKLRFDTGPQAAMFRQGGDGMPQIQGAEIPSKFFSSSRSQVENAQAFRRLVADDPQLMGDLRRYAITDAAGQVDQLGNLTNAKFNRWLAARSGATGEIFNDQQRAILKAIADDLRRAAVAENLGRSTGSDTAQKAANMMRLGLLDHPGTSWAASHVPGGQAALGFMRRPAQAAKAERLGGLLADPERVGGLLEAFIATQQPKQGQGLLSGAIDPLLYRTAPLLGVSR
jgi:hypothetical protein